MWRAYGGSTGVALVFNSKAMFSEKNALSTYTSPVLYEEPVAIARLFDEFCDRLETVIKFIASQPRAVVSTYLYEMLHFAVLSIKHPAFAEELEWRVIHAPYHEANESMKPVTEVIRGVPQIVYKLPLINIPDERLTGLETAESLDRIIIGPCNHPIETSFVLHEALKAEGIENPYETSTVPTLVEQIQLVSDMGLICAVWRERK